MNKRKILFYDDVPNLGGHEVMVSALVEQLTADPYELAFMLHPVNSALKEVLLRKNSAVQLIEFDYLSGSAQLLRTYYSVGSLLRLVAKIKDYGPDLLVVVQGGIALSSLGLLAGRLAGVRTISYIPMTHPESIFSRSRLKSLVRTVLSIPLANAPHLTVTISARMAVHLRRRRRGPIEVVENGISLPACSGGVREKVRKEIGVAAGDILFGVFGRIELWQKRHDVAMEALAAAVERRPGIRLVVVGDGPDKEVLVSRCAALALSSRVTFQPWQAEMHKLYAAVDYLLIPSRYEGVPLVMLEAMYLRRKIIASNVDGMADMLPSHWLFPEGDQRALAELMVSPESADDAMWIERHHRKVAEEHTLEAFGRRFRKVIDEQLRAS